MALLVSATLLMSSLSAGSVFAFSDVGSNQAEAVTALQQQGIVNGVDADHFVPQGKITVAESVQLIVRAFGYNLDNMRFTHMPVASEFYSNINNESWYANAFVIAHYNGL